MEQFCVYKNKNTATKKEYPYLLSIQTHLLDELKTVVVIPLIRKSSFKQKPIKNLMPEFQIEGKDCVLLTPQLAGIPKSQLGLQVEDLNHFRSEIINAVDFIISGI